MLYHRRMKPIVLPAEIAPYVTAAADAMFGLGLSGHARELRRSPAREHVKKAATASAYREILGIDGATAALTALLALADVIGAGDYVRACVERERHHVRARREADANGTRVSLAAGGSVIAGGADVSHEEARARDSGCSRSGAARHGARAQREHRHLRVQPVRRVACWEGVALAQQTASVVAMWCCHTPSAAHSGNPRSGGPSARGM